jgi:hypothetical protein
MGIGAGKSLHRAGWAFCPPRLFYLVLSGRLTRLSHQAGSTGRRSVDRMGCCSRNFCGDREGQVKVGIRPIVLKTSDGNIFRSFFIGLDTPTDE